MRTMDGDSSMMMSVGLSRSTCPFWPMRTKPDAVDQCVELGVADGDATGVQAESVGEADLLPRQAPRLEVGAHLQHAPELGVHAPERVDVARPARA
jgi:hypothetical protein